MDRENEAASTSTKLTYFSVNVLKLKINKQNTSIRDMTQCTEMNRPRLIAVGRHLSQYQQFTNNNIGTAAALHGKMSHQRRRRDLRFIDVNIRLMYDVNKSSILYPYRQYIHYVHVHKVSLNDLTLTLLLTNHS